MAGQGSGKTFGAGMVSKTYIDHFPHVRGLIAANTYKQLNQATLYRIREFWKQCGMIEFKEHLGYGDYIIGKIPPKSFDTKYHNYDRYDNIISFRNGCVVYIGSLDNYQSLDGIEVAWAILDETKDTREIAVSEVILGRIRQEGIYISDQGLKTMHKEFSVKAFNPLYIFTSPAKVPWLNDWFKLDDYEAEIMSKIFSKDEYFKMETDGKLVTISSVYLNEDNLPEGWIEQQKKNMPSHLHDMFIYGCPFSSSGGEFWKAFDRRTHVKNIKINLDLPLHISFDENVNPYPALSVWQVNGKYAMQIHEIALRHPNNKLTKVAHEFVRWARGKNWSNLVYIYGDSTSQKEDAKLQSGYNYFTMLRNEIEPHFRCQIRKPSKNPPVALSADFINTIYENNYEGISISIDESCKESIKDYTMAQEAADGTMIKKKTDGVELIGHFSDNKRYFLTEIFRSEFRKYQRGTSETDFVIEKRKSMKFG